MVDRSRDLSWVRDGRTRWPPANPGAEAAQDLLEAPRLVVSQLSSIHSSCSGLEFSGNIYCNPPLFALYPL